MSDQVPIATTAHRRWWHYTSGTRFMGLVREGWIRIGDARVAMRERRAVWFSCRNGWEPTASVGITDERGETRDRTIAEMVADFGPLVRLEVPESVARHTWADHRRVGGLDWRAADEREGWALAVGADPDEWRLSYQDVPPEGVLGAEASEDGREWVPVTKPGPKGVGVATVDEAFLEKVRAALKTFNVGLS